MNKIKLLSTKFVKENFIDLNYLSLNKLQKSLESKLQDTGEIFLSDYCFGPSFLQLNGLIIDAITDESNPEEKKALTFSPKTFMTHNQNTNISFIELIKTPSLEEGFSRGDNDYQSQQFKDFLKTWINTTKNLTVQVGSAANFSFEEEENTSIPYNSLLNKADLPTEEDSIIPEFNSLCRGLSINKLILNDTIITGIDCSNLEELTLNLPNLQFDITIPLLPSYKANQALEGNKRKTLNYKPKKDLTVNINNSKINFTNYLQDLPIKNLNYLVTSEQDIISTKNIENISLNSNNFNKLIIANTDSFNNEYFYKSIHILSGDPLINNDETWHFSNLEKLIIEDNILKIGKSLFKHSNNLNSVVINTTEDTLKLSRVIIDSKAFQVNHKITVSIPNVSFNNIYLFTPIDDFDYNSLPNNKLCIAIDAFTVGSQIYYKGNILQVWENIKELDFPIYYGDIENFKTYYQLSQIQDLYRNPGSELIKEEQNDRI